MTSIWFYTSWDDFAVKKECTFVWVDQSYPYPTKGDLIKNYVGGWGIGLRLFRIDETIREENGDIHCLVSRVQKEDLSVS